MTILSKTKTLSLSAALLASTAAGALAEDYTITVWAGGSGASEHYRADAIQIAADFLMREAAIRGEELNITIESQLVSGWDEFKQAFTLAAESGTAPDIVVSGHEDIGPWSQAGLLRPVEDYLFFDQWPLNDIYPNLIDIATYNGIVWGIPQDAEARIMFWSIPALEAIGWSADEIASLPARVQSGDFTLYDMLDVTLAEKDAGLVDEAFAPRPSNGPDYWQFYQSFGGEMTDPESGKLVLDTAALTAMYQFFVDAVEKGAVSETYLGREWDSWHRAVAGGTVGAWHGGSWQLSGWVSTYGMADFFGDVQFSLIPAGNEAGRANSITHPLVYLLAEGNSEDEAAIAAELIAIASEPRINALHAVESGHLAIGEAEVSVPLYANDRWLSEASAFLPYVNAIPNNADFGTYWTAMYKGLESAWTGISSVEDAVKGVVADVTASLGDAIIVK